VTEREREKEREKERERERADMVHGYVNARVEKE